MQSKASTVDEYLASLPEDRRAAIAAVRDVVLKNVDRGIEEGMQYGMIGYYIPHRVYPAGYHCDPKQPLPFAGLASQKGYMSLYLMSVYEDGELERWLRAEAAKRGLKLDMGKCCIRFRKLDDLPLDLVAEVLRRSTVSAYVARYEALLATRKTPVRKAAKKAAAKAGAKPPAKKAAKTATKEATKPAPRTAPKAATKKAVKSRAGRS
ncbi:DUF1801 domain-containing protein [Acidobacteria bacterium ACD]|nr:MAG: DUF1801 domain-containing protein [Acidobacteriota bacterium]MCE7957283.1 DUF1801 domain-containing protein [Acidobacteria bacterium ACB2]MDL1950786.1 DUF1801 domain-containing protein [Acidobacteria bacterium ACD]